MTTTCTLARILLIEDSAADAELLLYLFMETKICNPVEVITNGSVALERLLDKDGDCRPDIVFLDLDLPGLCGCEILEALPPREKRPFSVVVLSGEDVRLDRLSALSDKCDGFLSKPVSLPTLMDTIKAMRDIQWGILSARPHDTQPV